MGDAKVLKIRGTTLYRTKRTEHEPNTNRTSKRTEHCERLFVSVRVRQETNMTSVRFAQCLVRFGSVRLGSVRRAHSGTIHMERVQIHDPCCLNMDRLIALVHFDTSWDFTSHHCLNSHRSELRWKEQGQSIIYGRSIADINHRCVSTQVWVIE